MEVSEEMAIVNSLGMHLRPAQQLVQVVLKFSCDVNISKDGHQVNAKSIMGLLTLAAACGTRLKIVCRGDDAQEAIDAVRELVESGFGEE
ncbi:MAG: HPr family phosphocarrier protein [Candidatus Hydrogenedentes bacterium]|nr:HPr family phosphocarrier protein [Candidatus Hydrogenedentota bacterium]